MWTRHQLAAHLAEGHVVEWLFFWGHTQKAEALDRSCLSQWFPRPFVLDGLTYATAEHYMMAEKARLFGDEDALAGVLACATPQEAKAFGRAVRHYDDAAWKAARFEAVVRGNVAKFGSHPDLAAFLAATGDAVIVEASPRDVVWGIGMGASNPDAQNPARWRGQNLLGFALMEVRKALAAGA